MYNDLQTARDASAHVPPGSVRVPTDLYTLPDAEKVPHANIPGIDQPCRACGHLNSRRREKNACNQAGHVVKSSIDNGCIHEQGDHNEIGRSSLNGRQFKRATWLSVHRGLISSSQDYACIQCYADQAVEQHRPEDRVRPNGDDAEEDSSGDR
jgi:hypothetical protein